MNNDSNLTAALTHLTKDGSAQMVNVGHKAISSRRAVASAVVMTTPEVVGLLLSASLKKGLSLIHI